MDIYAYDPCSITGTDGISEVFQLAEGIQAAGGLCVDELSVSWSLWDGAQGPNVGMANAAIQQLCGAVQGLQRVVPHVRWRHSKEEQQQVLQAVQGALQGQGVHVQLDPKA